MYYRVLVMKIEDNPAFDPIAAADFDERTKRGYYSQAEPYTVSREIGTRQLDIILTEGEFQAMKESVLKTFG